MANWEGYEPLRQQILNEVPRYGNDIPYVDEIARESMEIFATAFLKGTGDRGNRWQAGIYPVSTHVVHGKRTGLHPTDAKHGNHWRKASHPNRGLTKTARRPSSNPLPPSTTPLLGTARFLI